MKEKKIILKKILNNILKILVATCILIALLNITYIVKAKDLDTSEIYSQERAEYYNTKADSKKGVSYYNFDEAKDLNFNYGFIDIVYGDLLDCSNCHNKCSYTYCENGKNYNFTFNQDKVMEIGNQITTLANSGVTVTAGLLSEKRRKGCQCEQLVSSVPRAARDDYHSNESSVTVYGFNVSDEEGIIYIKAITQFIKENYPEVSKWVVGDEVNDYHSFYYTGITDINSFTENYAKAFRIIYDKLKGDSEVEPNVYICLNYIWGNDSSGHNFSGKEVLNKFSDDHNTKDINWNIAYHPYSFPGNDSVAWDDGDSFYKTEDFKSYKKCSVEDDHTSDKGFYVTKDDNTDVVTMYNIEQLVKYLYQDKLLYKSNARKILLTEQGYPASENNGIQDQVLQAASITYAYYKTLAFKNIEAFIIYRYKDGLDSITGEATSPSQCGLIDAYGNKKYSYDIYKNLNTKESLNITDFAKKLIGINDWKDAIPTIKIGDETICEFDESIFSEFPSADRTIGVNDLCNSEVSTDKIQIYTGEEIKPSVSVKYNGKNLKENVDYLVAYYNNTSSGKASIIIRGKGSYSGYKVINFNIYSNNTKYDGLDYSLVFNAKYYYDNNADVAEQFGNSSEQLLWHFVNYGMAEGRVASKNFNVVKYMYCLLNDDLRKAYGSKIPEYYKHYINFGYSEGRHVSDWDSVFDYKYYLANNPGLEEAITAEKCKYNIEGWALWHFCEFGINEYKRGNDSFGVLNYMAANPDVFYAYHSDLKSATIHYLQYGHGRPTTAKYDMYSLDKIRGDVIKVYGSDKIKWVEWYVTAGYKE